MATQKDTIIEPTKTHNVEYCMRDETWTVDDDGWEFKENNCYYS
jgi:hypothetical protein